MITKEIFIKYINAWGEFEKGIRRIEEALSGNKKYSPTNLFESDWFEAVDRMLMTFLDLNFTDAGVDLICAFLFESLDYSWKVEIFEESGENIYIDTPEKLWDYMIKEKDIYFNV